jgi:hypothetical protein
MVTKWSHFGLKMVSSEFPASSAQNPEKQAVFAAKAKIF